MDDVINETEYLLLFIDQSIYDFLQTMLHVNDTFYLFCVIACYKAVKMYVENKDIYTHSFKTMFVSVFYIVC